MITENTIRTAGTLHAFLATSGAMLETDFADACKHDDYLTVVTAQILDNERKGFSQELILKDHENALPTLLIAVDVPDTELKLLIGAYYYQCFNAGLAYAYSENIDDPEEFLLEDTVKVAAFCEEHFDLEYKGVFSDKTTIGYE